MVRIMLADSHVEVRKQLAERLSREPAMRVVDQVSTAPEILERVHASRPHVLIVDPSTRTDDYLGALKNLRHQLPELRIVVLASVIDTYLEIELKRIGVHLLFTKGFLTERMLQEIMRLVGG